MKKFLPILLPSIFSALALNILIFNVIENVDTRFDNRGIYFLFVFMLSFAISIVFNILLDIVTDLQKRIKDIETKLEKNENLNNK